MYEETQEDLGTRSDHALGHLQDEEIIELFFRDQRKYGKAVAIEQYAKAWYESHQLWCRWENEDVFASVVHSYGKADVVAPKLSTLQQQQQSLF